MNLTLTSGGNAATGLQWTLQYPASAITRISATAGAALAAAGKSISCAGQTGAFTCVAYGMNAATIADGVVATVTVQASQSAAISLNPTVAASVAGANLAIAGISGSITVMGAPAASTPTISSLACTPTAVTDASPASCTLTLSAATSAALSVGLVSSNPAVVVPASVTIPAGSQAATFTAAYSGTTSGTAVLKATLAFGSSASFTLTVTASQPPVISGVSASAITSSGAIITWTTTTNSDSQVAYNTGGNMTYSPLQSALVTAHSVTLTGLQPSTTYYYQVLSRDAQGRQVQSGSFSFITLSPSGTPVLFLLHSDASELSGTSNGSTITPAVAPSGLTGKVVVTSGGSVNFSPASAGGGVYFLNCCGNTSNAYYKFTGSAVGNLFSMSGGRVSFYLRSRQSFAQRLQAGSFRMAFDVRDSNALNHLFYFMTETLAGRLVFSYQVGASSFFYYVPAGAEDAVFGSGVSRKVEIQWDGTKANLYLDNILVQSTAYQAKTPSWTSLSVFDIGAQEYLSYGGYNSSDDIIDEFTISH
jgi:hypothetical protein